LRLRFASPPLTFEWRRQGVVGDPPVQVVRGVDRRHVHDLKQPVECRVRPPTVSISMSDPGAFGDEDGERGTGVHAGSFKFTQPLRDLGIGGSLSRLPAFYFRYNAWRYVDVAPVLRPVERVAFGVGEPSGLAHFPDRTLGTGTDVTRPAHGVSCSR